MPNDANTATLDPEIAAKVAEVWGDAPISEPESTEAEATEPAKAPEPTEKPASARIVAIKRAEARDAQRRSELRAKEEALSAKEREVAAREAEAKLLEEDPTRYFEIKKLGPEGIRKHLEKLAGEYKPEAVADRKLSAQEQRIADLEAKLKAKDQAAEDERRTAMQRAAEEQGAKDFLATIETNVEKYPHLAEEFTPEETVKMGFAVLHEVIGVDSQGRKVTRLAAFKAGEGRVPTNDEIAEFIDGVAKARIENRQKNAWRKRGERAETGSEPSSGEVNKVPTVTGTRPRTLSARDTSSRATAPSAKWTQEWADEESLRILRDAIKG